ncbi:hypothetical protein [Priestia megaterium]|uniref:hypothetical protein n=1 Tax=Priestia megaterium TaxID=1404 RepID=UPI002E24AECC|nr:hypothetical protein [Priestia megaterium]
MEDNHLVPYYIVLLGNMFYAGGLARKKPVDLEDEVFSHEYVSNEELAFPILSREAADRIASQCGGVVVPKEAEMNELIEIGDLNERFTQSELEWEKDQLKQFLGTTPRENK